MKHIHIKKQMSGRELAALLYQSGLKWNNGAMHRQGRDGAKDSYCLLGQIARYAGFDNKVIDHSEEYGEIPDINDACETRAELRSVLCTEHGEKVFDLEPFLDELQNTKENMEDGDE